MPRKIRQLIADLTKAGFLFEGGKGSHRKFVHPAGPQVVVSGNEGDDAHHYQEKNVQKALNDPKLREKENEHEN